MASPLEQFQIKPLIQLPKIAGVDISYTNSSLWMTIAVIVVFSFVSLGMRRAALVPGRWQSMAELSYEFIANMLKEQVGTAGLKYFPLVFTLFMFILAGNLLGMVPYSFTFTSHIIVTFGLAFVVFIGVTVVGFIKHGVHFLSFFVPKGVPAVMLILLVPIEILSYLIRPVSLSIRLFANMIRGKNVDEAIQLLRFYPNRGAKLLLAVVESAHGNADHRFTRFVDDGSGDRSELPHAQHDVRGAPAVGNRDLLRWAVRPSSAEGAVGVSRFQRGDAVAAAGELAKESHVPRGAGRADETERRRVAAAGASPDARHADAQEVRRAPLAGEPLDLDVRHARLAQDGRDVVTGHRRRIEHFQSLEHRLQRHPGVLTDSSRAAAAAGRTCGPWTA